MGHPNVVRKISKTPIKFTSKEHGLEQEWLKKLKRHTLERDIEIAHHHGRRSESGVLTLIRIALYPCEDRLLAGVFQHRLDSLQNPLESQSREEQQRVIEFVSLCSLESKI